MYWKKKHQQQVVIFPTRTNIQLCLDIAAVKYVHIIPRVVCNINQAIQDLQRPHICLTVSDPDYILEKLNVDKTFRTKEIKGMMMMKNKFYLFLVGFYFVF